jgi:septal ring factor EnvC (AmiA/AmiB activator)
LNPYRTLARTLATLLILWISNVGAADQQEEQLAEVKQKLEQRQQLLTEQQKQQKQLRSRLKKTELKIAASAEKLHSTRRSLKQNRQQQHQLSVQKKQLTTSAKQQQQVLAKQLASAYMIGGNDLIQLLLNQQQSGKIERLLGYYKYINQARLDTLNQLKQTTTELATIEQELAQASQQLISLEQRQQIDTKKLKQNKQSRNKALATLKKRYLANSVSIEQLQLSEIDLNRLIKESIKPSAPQQKKLTGLAARKGKLKPPNQGTMVNKFGRARQGTRRWKGITINGKEGQAVNVISHGKVLYADWVKGFGLVIVVDHGKGYMTLYGHNQALLKSAGDYVDANEQIALLGQSGGQNKPVLYFELRHKGKAINPRRWFQR